MELSMYTVYALNQNFPSPVEALKHFKKKGIDYADIVDTELEEYPLHIYNDFLQEANIKAHALISMLDIANFDDKVTNRNIEIVKDYIDQMEKLEMKLLMLAPEVKFAQCKSDMERMQNLFIESLDKIIDYARGSNIKVTIENQSVSTRADSRMKDVRYILDCLPELGFVLDCGNFFCINEDVQEAYKLLKDRVVHVHAKDWEFNEYGKFVRENIPRFDGVELGTGLIPLREIFKALKADGYTGKINLEINAGKITLDMLDGSADFLRSEWNV
ncbi:MAG: sugar phosphate isomerase/epimerase [Clostridia bacterium]|nr:sugar phosphate isomerase/epimerase [Clostridia bacterium]